MRFPSLALAVVFVALPCARGFVQSSFAARCSSCSDKEFARCRTSSNTGLRYPGMKRRATTARENAAFVMNGRISVKPICTTKPHGSRLKAKHTYKSRHTCRHGSRRSIRINRDIRAGTAVLIYQDRDLDGVRLDPSTLDEGEKKRVEGIRAIQSKMAEVDAKKQELRKGGAARVLEAAQGMDESVPVLEASAVDDGLSTEERRKAEGLASIERSLAEVTAIQRQLGIAVDEDEHEQDLEVLDTAWRGQAGLDVSDAADGTKTWADLSTRKGLAVGDLVALTLFAYVGRASHGMASFDLGVLVTALPFLIGWLAVSPLLGAYTRIATASPGDAAKSLVPAWGVSMPLAIFLRALSKGGEVPPIPFAVTSMIFTFVALLGWRQVYTAVNPTGEGDKQAGILDGFRMITTLLQRW